ncbi:MAG: hypothetical protein U9N34_03740 [Candidatus Cloacimonadota bacterium]|nr:hypothetical protein [Candidatus Cloacimonadota bacterium]
MQTYEEFQEETKHFYGTENYFRVNRFSPVVVTDGVKHVLESKQCYWFADIIMSYQDKLKDQGLQVWGIVVNEDNSATVTCEDGNYNILITQEIPFTDLATQKMVFWCSDGVIYLPSEH